jgi:hypothetical protein
MGTMIAAGGSSLYLSFALNAPRYEKSATAPLFGWISGTPAQGIRARCGSTQVRDSQMRSPLQSVSLVQPPSADAGGVEAAGAFSQLYAAPETDTP